jgi:hypothetical protein
VRFSKVERREELQQGGEKSFSKVKRRASARWREELQQGEEKSFSKVERRASARWREELQQGGEKSFSKVERRASARWREELQQGGEKSFSMVERRASARWGEKLQQGASGPSASGPEAWIWAPAPGRACCCHGHIGQASGARGVDSGGDHALVVGADTEGREGGWGGGGGEREKESAPTLAPH